MIGGKYVRSVCLPDRLSCLQTLNLPVIFYVPVTVFMLRLHISWIRQFNFDHHVALTFWHPDDGKKNLEDFICLCFLSKMRTLCFVSGCWWWCYSVSIYRLLIRYKWRPFSKGTTTWHFKVIWMPSDRHWLRTLKTSPCQVVDSTVVIVIPMQTMFELSIEELPYWWLVGWFMSKCLRSEPLWIFHHRKMSIKPCRQDQHQRLNFLNIIIFSWALPRLQSYVPLGMFLL